MPPSIVTLIPFRPSGDRHLWLWDQTRPYLEALGFPIYTGEPRGEEWARAQAVNAAAEAAGDDWDIALIGDCDTIPDPAAIRRAIAWVQDSGGAVRPHGERVMLNNKGTIAFLQRGPSAIDPQRHLERSHPGGGLLIVTRDAWETVGGYDETFIGWGYEDSDFNLRLLRQTRWDRLPGTAWHLYHGRKENAPRRESKERYHRMRDFDYKRDIAAWAVDKGLKFPKAVF